MAQTITLCPQCYMYFFVSLNKTGSTVPAKLVPSHQGTLQSIAQLNQLGARSLVSDWSNTADT